MMEKENRRIHPRVDAQIQVHFRNNAEFITCYTENISQGGIYLETPIIPDPNALIELVLDIGSASDTEKIKILSRVVRLMTIVIDSKPINKVALQFIDVPEETQKRIAQLYEKVSAQS